MNVCLMAAGNFNVGDNALLHSWLSVLNDMLTIDDVVYVLGIEPSYMMQYNSKYKYRIAATNALYRYFAACPDEEHMKMRLRSLFGELPYDGFSYELRQIREIFAEIDLLHIVGGGTINCMWLDMQYLTMAAIGLAKRNKKRVIMTGQTLGPFHKADEDRLLPYLRKVDLLDLRDDCPWLKRAHVKYQVTVDDVLAYIASDRGGEKAELPSPLDRFAKNKYITVCLQSWNLSEEDQIKYTQAKRNIALFLNEALAQNPRMQVYFLEFMHFDRDRENNQEVYNLLSENAKARCRFITCSNFYPFDVAAFAGKAQFCITTRLHLSIFTMLKGIPVYSLVLDQYYRQKLEGAYDAFDAHHVFEMSECSSDSLRSCYNSKKHIGKKKHVQKQIELKYQMVREIYEKTHKRVSSFSRMRSIIRI